MSAAFLSAPYSPARADKDKNDDDRAGFETVELTKASFRKKKSQLRVDAKIKHVPKGAAYAVRLFDDITGSLLAEKISKKKKEVEFRLDGFSETNVPCRVRVEVEDLSAVALVKNAPTRCGEGPRIVAVTVEEAKFKTSKGDLKIEGKVKVEKSRRDGDDRDKDDKAKDNDRDRNKNGKAKDYNKDDDRDREKNGKAKDDDDRDKKRKYVVRLFDDITGRLVAEDTDKGKKFEIKVENLSTYEVPCRVRAVVDDVYAVRMVRNAPPDCSNFPPVADAGPGQLILVGVTAMLDGTGSSDKDKDPLTYTWSLLSVPAGSTATLSDPSAASPTLFIDRAGTYTVGLVVNDGKVDSVADTVAINTLPPVVKITSPSAGALLGAIPAAVSGTVNDPSVAVVVNGVGATVNGSVQTGGTFTASVTLAEGPGTISATATDPSGKTGSDSVAVVLDTTAPVIAINSPTIGTLIGSTEVSVSGTVDDANPPAAITINGASVPLTPTATGGSFGITVPLPIEGANTITVSAMDLAGHTKNASVTVTRDTTAPVVQITAPTDSALVGATETTVGGNVVDTNPPTTITINGAAVPLGTDGSFSAVVPLPAEGANTITVIATDLAGNTGEAGISVIRDTAPPVVTIDTPTDGALIGANEASVSGTVIDVAPPATVTINGNSVPLTPTAVGGSFTATVPLPAEGTNTIAVSATDLGGLTGNASVTVTRDTTAPVVQITAPTNGALIGATEATVSGNVVDANPPTTISINGAAVSLGTDGSFSAVVPLPVEGANAIAVSATDLAGNTGGAGISVIRDTTPPVITITSFGDGALRGDNPTTVTGTVADAHLPSTVTVNGVTVSLTGDFFTARVTLQEGSNTITVGATDAAGNNAAQSVSVILDTTPPEIVIDSPADGATLGINTVTVSGSVSDLHLSDSVSLNGVTVPLSGDTFSTDVTLTGGLNTIRVASIDQAGNGGAATIAVFFAVITITSPDTLITVGSSPLQISGTIADPDAALTVNGAPVTHGGGAFSASASLKEGLNTIVARAVSVGGGEITDSIVVSLDKTPPQVTIEAPTKGQVFTTEIIAVTGLVNDIVRGTISAGQANVNVNGIPAAVSNRTYLAENVPLQIGDNTITVATADQVGNTASASVTVRRNPALGNRIELVSGQGQSASIQSELPAPLTARLVDDAGNPVSGKNVVFRVIQGDGVVGVGSPAEAQAAIVVSDVDGLASTRFRLGTRAGTGNQRVRATTVGFQGEVVFHASAGSGAGNKISVIDGNNQRGAVNSPLPRPLIVAVTDAGANLIANTNVEFSVSKGGGRFQNGKTVYATATDTDGRASAELTIGPAVGLDAHRVTAQLLGTTAGAGFIASGLVPGDPGQTRISGVVLDNQDKPVPGVTVRIDGTSRQSVADAQGQFKITEVPVGPVHLLADGSTATVPGEWPTLSYNIVTVAGAGNPLPAPIYMVKLDTASAKLIGHADVEFTLPEVPGFKLTVLAGSVTFPDGAKSGLLSVTAVNANKVPMPPPNGMQPQFIVTIQPTGAKFDPPAPLQLPNADGHAPGAEVEMYSYDHDLEEFVTIGVGTVSTDGAVIASNNGVGVIKAGWHCGSQPGGSGCLQDCPSCLTCTAPRCICDVPDDSNLPPDPIPGDCGGTACEMGNPISVVDDTDVPRDPILGDCGGAACENGNPISIVDDSDVPPDSIPGDCGANACNQGKLIRIADDNDKPPDNDKGNCKVPSCIGGIVAEKNDDNDPPEDKPGDCKSFSCSDGKIDIAADLRDSPNDVAGNCISTACASTVPVIFPDPSDTPKFCGGCCEGTCIPSSGAICQPNVALCGPNQACSFPSCTCSDVVVEQLVEVNVILVTEAGVIVFPVVVPIPIQIVPALPVIPLSLPVVPRAAETSPKILVVETNTGQFNASLAVGNYQALLIPPVNTGLAPVRVSFEVQGPGPLSLPINIFPGATVSGELVTQEAVPIPGAKIHVFDNAQGVGIFDDFAAPRTNQEGKFAVNLKPGSYTFTIEPPGELLAAPIEVNTLISNSAVDLGTLTATQNSLVAPLQNR